jgi:hypothetical protein
MEGRLRDAVLVTSEALHRYPHARNANEAKLCRAGALLEARRYEMAMMDVEEVLSSNARDCDALAMRAFALAGMGAIKPALAGYRHVIELCGDHMSAVDNARKLELRIAKCNGRLREIDSLLSIKPDQPGLRDERMRLCRALGMFDLALEDAIGYWRPSRKKQDTMYHAR